MLHDVLISLTHYPTIPTYTVSGLPRVFNITRTMHPNHEPNEANGSLTNKTHTNLDYRGKINGT